MSESSSCRRLVLAQRPGFRIVFCQAHQLIELEMGGVSVRLAPEAFAGMADSMQTGLQHLETLDTSQLAFTKFMQQFKLH